MRNLLALIGLVVVGVAVVGWYCGWYSLSVSKGTEGRPEIRTTVNTEKVSSDSGSFFERVGKLARERSRSRPPAETPVNTPSPNDGATQRTGTILPVRPASATTTPERR